MKSIKLVILLLASISIASALNPKPARITTKIYSTTAVPVYLGTISASNTKSGLLLMPDIRANRILKPGAHGFHLHLNQSCGDGGAAAGGHYDPHNTKSHKGPYGNGHLGDLPVLYANADGSITHQVIAPHLKLSDIKMHALMLHANGDNYSDNPLPNGGGGGRVACGVVQE
ncbi:MAG: superoxide dismutase family protein [Burkholderiales bacterium]|nr:superoxide dismutase family protein [Burkholderiales bacterium]